MRARRSRGIDEAGHGCAFVVTRRLVVLQQGMKESFQSAITIERAQI